MSHSFVFTSGNGVVIHLPGLFEEAEKNERKGKSECCTYFFFSFSEQNMVLVICVELTAYMRV